MSAVSSMDAVRWVNSQKDKILKEMYHTLLFSPYDVEDNLQVAYVCAIETKDIAEVGTQLFEEKFWGRLSNAMKEYATNPCVGDLMYSDVIVNRHVGRPTKEEAAQAEQLKANGVRLYTKKRRSSELGKMPEDLKDVVRMPAEFCEFDEHIDQHVQPSITATEFFEDPPVDIHRTYIQIRKFLLPNQVDVFTTILGLNGDGMHTYAEASAILGKSPASIHKIVSNICSRIEKHIASGKIDPSKFPKLTMIALPGGRNPQPKPAVESFQYTSCTEPNRMAA